MRRIIVLSICFGLTSGLAQCAENSSDSSPLGRISISVWNVGEAGSQRPVTGGIPLARGAAPDGVHFELHDEHDNPVPLQTSVLARWKDGSARWVLLDFQADPDPNTTSQFRLSWSRKPGAVHPEFPVGVKGQTRPEVRSQAVVVSPTGDAFL